MRKQCIPLCFLIESVCHPLFVTLLELTLFAALFSLLSVALNFFSYSAVGVSSCLLPIRTFAFPVLQSKIMEERIFFRDPKVDNGVSNTPTKEKERLDASRGAGAGWV